MVMLMTALQRLLPRAVRERTGLALCGRGTKIQKVPIETVFPQFEDCTVLVFHPSMTSTGCRLIELALFGYLAGARPDVHFFEIGTSEGRTARSVALNLGPGGQLTSIDLAADDLESARQMPDYQREEFSAAKGVYLQSLPEGLSRRITLLYGDSTKYDFHAQFGRYDVVLVDGSHALEAVLSDASTALSLVRPEGGIVLFHDYSPDTVPGVVAAVDALANSYPVRLLASTKLAVLGVGTPRIPMNTWWSTPGRG